MKVAELQLTENDLGWLYRAVTSACNTIPISDKRHWHKLLDKITEAQRSIA